MGLGVTSGELPWNPCRSTYAGTGVRGGVLSCFLGVRAVERVVLAVVSVCV